VQSYYVFIRSTRCRVPYLKGSEALLGCSLVCFCFCLFGSLLYIRLNVYSSVQRLTYSMYSMCGCVCIKMTINPSFSVQRLSVVCTMMISLEYDNSRRSTFFLIFLKETVRVKYNNLLKQNNNIIIYSTISIVVYELQRSPRSIRSMVYLVYCASIVYMNKNLTPSYYRSMKPTWKLILAGLHSYRWRSWWWPRTRRLKWWNHTSRGDHRGSIRTRKQC
jgi:hypothetical protein